MTVVTVKLRTLFVTESMLRFLLKAQPEEHLVFRVQKPKLLAK